MPEAPSPPDDWTEPERWAWEQIAAGKIADFNARAKEAGGAAAPLDPATADSWGAGRRLRASILQRILIDRSFVEATPFGGVRIRGALVDDAPIDLEHARLSHQFWLELSRIETAVQARFLRIDGMLSLAGSHVAGRLDLLGARVDERLILALGARFADRVSLTGACIGGQLVMTGASFARTVNLDDARIAASAFLDEGASFEDNVDLVSASIGDRLAMRGASFAGPVNLNGAKIATSAYLDNRASFEKTVDFGGASIGHQLVMTGASFAGPVNLYGAEIGESVFLDRGASFSDEIDLLTVTIGGNLTMKGASFAGPLNLNGAKIAGSVFVDHGASFDKKLDLATASIGGNLTMKGASFAGPVSLNTAVVKGSAFLNDGASFEKEVDLTVASFSRLTMNGASFAGPVKLCSANVTGPALLNDGATFKDMVDLTGAVIGADLDLSDADFVSTVHLTNARIGSELRLGSKAQPPARWGSGALILRNTHCASLQDRWPTTKEPEAPAWPGKVDLEGFTYDILGGLAGSGGGPADMRARPASSYVEWLARHQPFSPQPYEQLAKVLRASGDAEKANDILYAARERQRRDYGEAGTWWKWLGMSLLSGTIGYGLGRRYFRALLWVAAFTLLGTELLRLFGNQPDHSWLALAFASFDQLLPAVTLDRAHEALFTNAAAEGFAQPAGLIMYFYVHKLVGWLLGIFLLAGLAGLTQRS